MEVDPHRLVDSSGRIEDGEFVLHLVSRRGKERRHVSVVVDDVGTARDLLTEVSRLRGWIAGRTDSGGPSAETDREESQ